MKRLFKVLFLMCLVGTIFGAPLLYARVKYPASSAEDIDHADAAIVFGALVRDGRISPLHEERLRAAIDLLDRQVVQSIVVSNTRDAALRMALFLEDQGIPRTAIEIDDQAVKTPDTCRYEVSRGLERRVIFISQGFHIPRLSWLCEREGLSGQSLAAEAYRAADAGSLPFWRVAQIRLHRHLREAVLFWAALVGL